MLLDTLAEANKQKLVESWEVDGRPEEHGWQIAEEFRDWADGLHIELGIPFKDIHFVAESFELRPNKARGAGSQKNMLDPVRVTYAVAGIFELWNSRNERPEQDDYRIEYQTPQTGHRVSSARLREYGVWVVGSEHRRDAMRHLIQKASDVL